MKQKWQKSEQNRWCWAVCDVLHEWDKTSLSSRDQTPYRFGQLLLGVDTGYRSAVECKLIINNLLKKSKKYSIISQPHFEDDVIDGIRLKDCNMVIICTILQYTVIMKSWNLCCVKWECRTGHRGPVYGVTGGTTEMFYYVTMKTGLEWPELWSNVIFSQQETRPGQLCGTETGVDKPGTDWLASHADTDTYQISNSKSRWKRCFPVTSMASSSIWNLRNKSLIDWCDCRSR